MLIWLRRLAALCVSASAAVVVLGLGQRLHPALDSLSHFRLHFVVLLGLGSAAQMLLRHWAAAGISALAAAAGLLSTPVLFAANRLDGDASLTLLQFNALYNNQNPLAIIAQVRSSHADAITLQEVSSQTMVILKALRADYPNQHFCDFASVGGVALVSRWPILKKNCEDGLAWAQVDRDGQKLTLASLHLHWPWPEAQHEQVSELEPVLRMLPQPVLLAGDFNAAPWSQTASRIASAASTHVAGGVRLTWTVNPNGSGPWPFLPIDQILLPEGAEAEVHTGEFAGSDHLPVIARISLPR